MTVTRHGLSGLAAAVLTVSAACTLVAGSPWAVAAPGVRATSTTAGRQHAAVRPAATGARRVTFVNAVHQTIWVAASPDKAHPLAATGWVLRPGHSVTITVPDHWNGRFWGRTGCVFRHGRGHCQTGDCGGRLQCTGCGMIPATPR
jgi:hypothetical protein